MPTEYEMGSFLKEISFNLNYGYVYRNPDLNRIVAIDFWTNPLPIDANPAKPDYKIASKIAEKYGIKLVIQDFSIGGKKPVYKPVFAMTYKPSDDIEKDLKDITDKLKKAMDELEDKLKKLEKLVMKESE